MVQLRPMVVSDIAQVNRVNRAAFQALLRREKSVSFVGALLRPLALWEMYVTAEEDCAFVMVLNEQIVGYSFTHRWGAVGWFGPVGVSPEYQGHGFGKELVLLSVDSLQRRGATAIGMETMPDSVSNLGFYSRLGFTPRELSFVLSKSVKDSAVADGPPLLDFADLADSESVEVLKECRDLTESIRPGLDYTVEIEQTARYQYGTTVFSRDAATVTGLAVCHQRKYFRVERAETLRVKLAAVHRRTGVAGVNRLIHGIEVYAVQCGLSRVHLNISARHWEWLLHLMTLGYQIVASGIRMSYMGYEDTVDGAQADFSRWVG